MKTKRSERGFTLIELAVVVVIVGVLAVLAVVGYRKMINSSRVSEGTHMVQAIRVAQETYHSETGRYYDLGWGNFCPHGGTGAPSRVKAPWNPGCSSGTKTWAALPVHTDGPVMFGFVSQAGTTNSSGTPSPALPAALDGSPFGFTGMPANADYYLIGAAADIDGDPTAGKNTVIIGSSFSNELMTFNDGE